MLKNKTCCDYDAHHELARIVAEQSAVLLKNVDNILPPRKEQENCIRGGHGKGYALSGCGLKPH